MTMKWAHLYLKQIKHLVKATTIRLSGGASFTKQGDSKVVIALQVYKISLRLCLQNNLHKIEKISWVFVSIKE